MNKYLEYICRGAGVLLAGYGSLEFISFFHTENIDDIYLGIVALSLGVVVAAGTFSPEEG